MASQYKRLQDSTVLKADATQDLREAYDAGAFNTLQVQCRIIKSGTGGNLKLQHAAVNEEDAYLDISGATWACTGSGDFVTVSDFLRFVRWACDGSVAGNPVGLIDIVAKE